MRKAVLNKKTGSDQRDEFICNLIYKEGLPDQRDEFICNQKKLVSVSGAYKDYTGNFL